jgi:hypothetical protein
MKSVSGARRQTISVSPLPNRSRGQARGAKEGIEVEDGLEWGCRTAAATEARLRAVIRST